MTVLATTRLGAVRPISVQGQRVLDLHQQLARLIAARTGEPDNAFLLARPRIVESRDQITWDTLAEGSVQRLVDTDQAAQEDGRRRLDAVVAAVERAVVELLGAGDERRVADGMLLRTALSHPADTDIFLVGSLPVLINWGCEIAGVEPASVKPAHIVRQAPEVPDLARKLDLPTRHETIGLVTPKIPSRNVPEAPVLDLNRPPWRPSAYYWAWLVCLLLMLAEPFVIARVITDPGAALHAARMADETARAHLEQLNGEIAQKADQCPAPRLP